MMNRPGWRFVDGRSEGRPASLWAAKRLTTNESKVELARFSGQHQGGPSPERKRRILWKGNMQRQRKETRTKKRKSSLKRMSDQEPPPESPKPTSFHKKKTKGQRTDKKKQQTIMEKKSVPLHFVTKKQWGRGRSLVWM